MTYYRMSAHTLNSFSKESIDEAVKMGYEIIDELNIQVISTDNLIRNFISVRDVSFLSIDVEGMDFAILKSWDFKLSIPYVICIETIEFSSGSKRIDYNEIINFMEEKGYFVYADTYINTIFVNKKKYMDK